MNESLFLCTFQSFLVGIIVPDPEVMPDWAKKKGIVGTYKDMCKNLVGRWNSAKQIGEKVMAEDNI